MHIGRAHHPPPELHPASLARVELDLTRASPVVVAETSAPTGESGDPAQTYHPVSDLIQRQHLLHPDPLAPAPEARPDAYGGTPPVPSVIDLRA